MRNNSGDIIRLQHVFDAIEEIEDYIRNINFNEFMNNSMMRFACIKQMEIIGEASNHISEEVKNNFSEIEWNQIIGMRNIFVHEYFGIDSKLVWEIIVTDIPHLKKSIQRIITDLK